MSEDNDDTCVAESEREEIVNTQEAKKEKMKKIGILLVVSVVPYVLSLFLKNGINRIISLASSIFCPFFIIMYPGLMNLRLAKEFRLSKYSIWGIYAFMWGFGILLLISIFVNMARVFGGEDVSA